jgi:multidrug efflux pump subunit AcrA (membrane-fusion protein)
MNTIRFSILLLPLMLAACQHSSEKTKPIKEDITESVYASGIVKSRNQYQAFATVSGIIQHIWITEGDTVKKGQPLMLLSNETPRLNAENAEIAAAYSDIKANQDKLDELRINSNLARSKMQNDSLQLVRQQNLWSQDIGTRAELDAKELAYKNSRTAYEASLLTYTNTKRQLDFTSTQSKKNVQISRSIAKDYTIRSQVDGKVYSVLKEKGEIVSPQSPVAVIGAASDYYLELQVDEYDIARVKPGQKLLLTMDSYKDKVFEAVVEKIDPIMNERTRTFVVEAGFVTKPPVLYPNLSAEANIIIHTKKDALLIPRNYLLNDSLVLLEKDKPVKVTTGLKDYQKVEILSGLSPEQSIYKPGK